MSGSSYSSGYYKDFYMGDSALIYIADKERPMEKMVYTRFRLKPDLQTDLNYTTWAKSLNVNLSQIFVLHETSSPYKTHPKNYEVVTVWVQNKAGEKFYVNFYCRDLEPIPDVKYKAEDFL
jgi:hypothetical protein